MDTGTMTAECTLMVPEIEHANRVRQPKRLPLLSGPF